MALLSCSDNNEQVIETTNPERDVMSKWYASSVSVRYDKTISFDKGCVNIITPDVTEFNFDKTVYDFQSNKTLIKEVYCPNMIIYYGIGYEFENNNKTIRTSEGEIFTVSYHDDNMILKKISSNNIFTVTINLVKE